MDYKKTLESFLGTFTPATANEYRFKLKVFHSYLLKRKRMADENYSYIMGDMKPSDIIESVKYYIENCDVKYKLTLDGYFYAIAALFSFLHTEHQIENEMFSKKRNQLELKQLVDDEAEKHDLKAKQVLAPLSDDEVDRLLERCNSILNDPDTDKFTFSEQQKYNKQFSLFMSAIIVKIIIFSGVANDTLLSMQTSHVNTDLVKIQLNGYWVRLPDALSQQLKRYISIREEIVQDESNKLLFFSVGTLKQTNNSQMLRVMSEFLGHGKAMCIAKHSIIRKLDVGMPSELLMDFTGYSGDVMGHCLEIYHERMGLSAQKVIDIGVCSDRYFDNL